VELSETELRFQGVLNQSLQRTFTLKVSDAPISNLVVVNHDLVDADSGLVILGTEVIVDPAMKGEIDSPQGFSVTIGAGQKPGHYAGKLELVYEDQPEDQTLEVVLDVTLESVPAVAAEVNSKNLVLSAVPSWLSLPFGRPRVPEDAPELGEVTLTLIQDAEGEATVEQVDILTIRGSKNETLPGDAIAVTTDLPIGLSGQDAASIRIVAQGHNLPADSYATTVRAKVRNQPASVQVPLTVQIKDGPLLPLILLAVGPLVGVLIGLWNQEGKAKYDLQRRMERLRRRIESAEFLQAGDRAQAMKDLERAMDAIVNGEAVAQVTDQIDKLETVVAEKQKEAGEFLSGDVEPLLAKLQGIAVGKLVRDELVARLQDLRDRVTRGDFEDLAAARSLFAALQTNIGQLLRLAEQFDGLPAGEQKDATKKLLDQAPTLRHMDLILNPPTPGEALEGEAEVTIAERTPVSIAFDRYSLRLKWWRLAVSAIVYVFTLVVGWLTIYASSPTFGANPEDYVTLFLWGVAASVVGAGTISLQSIFDKAKQEQQPAS
jgi:hypothetical protein